MPRKAHACFCLSFALIGMSAEIAELHKDNFDDALLTHSEVLVHFSAPWSKRCDEMRPHLQEIADSETWGSRIFHATSDISDQRGYTSYIERYGVLRLPTVVLFRNGHANMYPYESPLTEEGVLAWLDTVTRTEMPARDPNANRMPTREEVLAALKKSTSKDTRAEMGQVSSTAQEETSSTQQNEQDTTTNRSTEATSSIATTSCDALHSSAIGDSTFEATVMDKSRDVFVLFFKPTAEFCAGNASEYGKFAQAVDGTLVTAVHMDVAEHKSPFVFEDSELPVIMLFPAGDKRPLEFDDALTAEALQKFAQEHGRKDDTSGEESKTEL